VGLGRSRKSFDRMNRIDRMNRMNSEAA